MFNILRKIFPSNISRIIYDFYVEDALPEWRKTHKQKYKHIEQLMEVRCEPKKEGRNYAHKTHPYYKYRGYFTERPVAQSYSGYKLKNIKKINDKIHFSIYYGGVTGKTKMVIVYRPRKNNLPVSLRYDTFMDHKHIYTLVSSQAFNMLPFLKRRKKRRGKQRKIRMFDEEIRNYCE